MKKILYIVTQPHFGGAQKYVQDLCLHLPQDKYEPIVAVGKSNSGSLDDFDWIRELKREGVKIIELKHVQRELDPLQDIMSGRELFQLFKNLRPDVIHLNSSKVGATGAVMAAWHNAVREAGTRAKIIYTVHGLVLGEKMPPWRRAYYWFAEWFGGGFKDTIICVSQNDRRLLLKHKIVDANKIHVIPVGIDLDNLNFLAREEARQKINQSSIFNFQASDFLIGTIAGLFQTKGLPYLVEAAQEIIKEKPETRFIVFGSGPEEHLLKSLIRDKRLENNFFITSYEQNAAQLLKAFDIFILPSLKEGLPYTLIEARSAGLPIIASHIGGCPEIIEHQKTGLLIEPANSHELYEAIKKLLSNESLRRELAATAPKKLDRFSLKRMIDATTKLY